MALAIRGARRARAGGAKPQEAVLFFLLTWPKRAVVESYPQGSPSVNIWV